MPPQENDTPNNHGGKASNPDRVSFSVRGNENDLITAINELHLTSGDVSRVGNIYYVRGLKPGTPINNQTGRNRNK